jgi:hypothetical protein
MLCLLWPLVEHILSLFELSLEEKFGLLTFILAFCVKWSNFQLKLSDLSMKPFVLF